MAGLMPVFGDGEWKVPAWKFWELAEWQAMYSIIGPVVVGVILIVLASAMHGRNRGILYWCWVGDGGLAVTDPEIGAFKVATPVEDTSTPIPEPLSSEEAGGTVDIPEKKIELVDKNVFLKNGPQAGSAFNEYYSFFDWVAFAGDWNQVEILSD